MQLEEFFEFSGEKLLQETQRGRFSVKDVLPTSLISELIKCALQAGNISGQHAVGGGGGGQRGSPTFILDSLLGLSFPTKGICLMTKKSRNGGSGRLISVNYNSRTSCLTKICYQAQKRLLGPPNQLVLQDAVGQASYPPKMSLRAMVRGPCWTRRVGPGVGLGERYRGMHPGAVGRGPSPWPRVRWQRGPDEYASSGGQVQQFL